MVVAVDVVIMATSQLTKNTQLLEKHVPSVVARIILRGNVYLVVIEMNETDKRKIDSSVLTMK